MLSHYIFGGSLGLHFYGQNNVFSKFSWMATIVTVKIYFICVRYIYRLCIHNYLCNFVMNLLELCNFVIYTENEWMLSSSWKMYFHSRDITLYYRTIAKSKHFNIKWEFIFQRNAERDSLYIITEGYKKLYIWENDLYVLWCNCVKIISR